jgi:eukaryotic-like serine/threonine-protein kinase
MTSEFSVGQHIGDYEILSILGLGGMGKVYKVRNVISDRTEAMKILLPDLTSNQSLADRFLREIRLLATLSHPNIAALRTALTYENQLVMIMEYVEGETLANRAARAPLSSADAVSYADQVLSALGYAHKQNIIHRDIKPANMMLTPQGIVKLMDFGIARSATDMSLTSTGMTLGSLNYMPPEQVRGEAADARSDIYSFGVSLYELLTGKLPFQGDSQYSLMTAHLTQTPPAPITLRGDLPSGLNEIIMMAIAKDPANRFQSAEAFRSALSTVQVTHMPVSSATVTSTPSKPSGATTLVDLPPTARPTTTPVPPRNPALAPSRAPAVAVPAQAAAPPSAGRGMWLAIGAVLGIAVLIAAGMYIPRHLGTHADPSKAASPANGNTATTNSATASTTDASATPSNPAVSLQAPEASVKVDPNGNVSVESPVGSMQVDAQSGSVKFSVKPTTPADHKKVASGSPTTPQATTPSEPAPPPGPSPEEIAKVEDMADKLNARAAAASQSVETLRQQQNSSGYSLRADISSAQQRMQLYLSKGDAALKAQDLTNAEKYFTMADTELAKLEKFLGH